MAQEANKAEVEERVAQIYKQLILRQSRTQILQFASKNWGKLSDRQIDTYIKKARNLLLADFEVDRKVLLAEHIASRNYLYQKSLADKRYQTCLNVLDSVAKLEGLFESLDKAIDTVTAHGFEVSDPTSAIAESESEDNTV
jgi:hypothetical protein